MMRSPLPERVEIPSLAVVVHSSDDLPILEKKLLPALPSLGFHSWLSLSGSESVREGANGEATFVTVSRAVASSNLLKDAARGVLESANLVIPLQVDDTESASVAEALKAKVSLDLRDSFWELYKRLWQLLPAPDQGKSYEGAASPEGSGQSLEWNEQIFSEALVNALVRQDHTWASELVTNFALHCSLRLYPYGEKYGISDLKALKSYRKFGLMTQLAESILGTGTHGKGTVRRLYAQALIEVGQFNDARRVLDGIVEDSKADPFEIAQAKGLKGRLFKQLYVDAPDSADAEENIQRAMEQYREVYEEDPSQLWHGINVVSCTLRASRDGLKGFDPEYAYKTAEQILATLEKREQQETGKELPVWDRATKVEAHLALGQEKEAEEALDAYLQQARSPRAQDSPYAFFEVASTYRQFAQVLTVEKDSEDSSRRIMGRLREEVERYRSGLVLQEQPGGLEESTGAGPKEPVLRPLLIRVSDPGWEPEEIPDLKITSRMGTVRSASGSEASVEALLRDLRVISVDESYPAGAEECEHSMPYVKATAVRAATGETGSNALIAVIDNGIDVLHEAFLDANGASRIEEIWDQKDDSGPAPPGFSDGTLHPSADIANYLAARTTPVRLGRNRRGHGTPVARIAAGRSANPFVGGVAPDARIVVVISASREYLGYSSSHVQALHYIDQVATRLGLPVVVNVSQGMNAGAHDGKSALEIAFNEFSGSGRRPGRVIVKSAGNERHKKAHAELTLPPSSLEKVEWSRHVAADSARERIELWWNSANEFEFRLGSPSSDWSARIQPDQTLLNEFPSGNRYRLEYTRRHVDNGHSRLLRRCCINRFGQSACLRWARVPA